MLYTFQLLYDYLIREVKKFQQKSEEIKREALNVLDFAHAECENKIESVRTESDKTSQHIREESLHLQSENEILIGKLEAVVESHSECLKKSKNVFEDHDDSINNIVKDSMKRYEDFEDNAYHIRDTQEKLEEKTSKQFEDIETKVRAVGKRTENFESCFDKVSLAISKIYRGI